MVNTFSSHSDDRTGGKDLNQVVDALAARVYELETLCSEIYVAAVEIGMPQPLIERLWKIAGQGTTPQAFSFDLPPRAQPKTASGGDSRPPSNAQKSHEAVAVPAPPALQPLPVRKTLLVVDDDPMMLEVLVRILRRENYELIAATGGLDALAKAALAPNGIDLLVTDCEMPDLKGPEVAARLRERQPDLKVLYQTGFSNMLFDAQVELDSASAFLEKPFSARGLQEAVRLLIFDALNPSSSRQ